MRALEVMMQGSSPVSAVMPDSRDIYSGYVLRTLAVQVLVILARGLARIF